LQPSTEGKAVPKASSQWYVVKGKKKVPVEENIPVQATDKDESIGLTEKEVICSGNIVISMCVCAYVYVYVYV
jgi:hypothetical protein